MKTLPIVLLFAASAFGQGIVPSLGPTLDQIARPGLVWNVPSDCTGNADGGKLTVNGSEEIVCADDAGGAGSGDNVSVNGTAVSDADFDDADPAAPANAVNMLWQLNTATAPDSLSAYLLLTLIDGAGIGVSATELITDSTEADFLTSGALTCGASTQGKAQVHTTPLQYCDNAATPALQYAAYGASDGDAVAGDSLVSFFPAFTTAALATELSDEDYEPGDEVSTEAALEVEDLNTTFTDSRIPYAASSALAEDTNLEWDPTNDILNLGSPTTGTTNARLNAELTSTETATFRDVIRAYGFFNAGGASSARLIAGDFTSEVLSGNGQNYTSAAGGVTGIQSEAVHSGTATVSTAYGNRTIVSNKSTGTLSLGAGFLAENCVNSGGGTFTSCYGVLVQGQTAGASSYGIGVKDASTAGLWLSLDADSTDAAGGMAFGLSKDLKIYRNAAGVLDVENIVDAATGFRI